MNIKERWPNLADWASVGELQIGVYHDTAILFPPDADFDVTHAALLSSQDLRDLARAALWAADRIDNHR